MGRDFIKFAGDTALLSLLYDNEHVHSDVLPAFKYWCDEHFFDLNVSKTKEMTFDFRMNKPVVVVSTIHGEINVYNTVYRKLDIQDHRNRVERLSSLK